MKANFKIISFTEIELNGIKLDLHNNFDFASANTEISENRLSLQFRKSSGDWAINTEYQNPYFIFDNYNYLKQIEPNPEFIEDDSCLSGITFFDNNFREEDYNLIEREVPNEGDDIIFSFESERLIRVNCENLTLIAV